jgi:hypothetical protein
MASTSRRSFGYLASAAMALVCLIMLFGTATFVARAKPAEATVVSTSRHHYIVEFRANDNQLVRAERTQPRARSGGGGYHDGDQQQILYDPLNATHVKSAKWKDLWLYPSMWGLLAIMLLGLTRRLPE